MYVCVPLIGVKNMDVLRVLKERELPMELFAGPHQRPAAVEVGFESAHASVHPYIAYM